MKKRKALKKLVQVLDRIEAKLTPRKIALGSVIGGKLTTEKQARSQAG